MLFTIQVGLAVRSCMSAGIHFHVPEGRLGHTQGTAQQHSTNPYPQTLNPKTLLGGAVEAFEKY